MAAEQDSLLDEIRNRLEDLATRMAALERALKWNSKATKTLGLVLEEKDQSETADLLVRLFQNQLREAGPDNPESG